MPSGETGRVIVKKASYLIEIFLQSGQIKVDLYCPFSNSYIID